MLLQVGRKYGYHPKLSKFHLIVEEEHLDRAKFIFKGSEVKITKNGQRQLGAAIGSNWSDQLIHLSKIAEMEPQAVYAAFLEDFKSKFT